MKYTKEERTSRMFGDFRWKMQRMSANGILYLAFAICNEVLGQDKRGRENAPRQFTLRKMDTLSFYNYSQAMGKVLPFCSHDTYDADHFRRDYSDLIPAHHHELMECIVETFTRFHGVTTRIAATGASVSKLMAMLIRRTGTTHVFDPFAGLCGFAAQPEFGDINFMGQEISSHAMMLGNIRLYASGYLSDFDNMPPLYHDTSTTKRGWVELADSSAQWPNGGFDCVASEIPFGVRIGKGPKTLEDLTLERFIGTEEIRHAVLLVSGHTLHKESNQELRETLCSQGLVECVIALPAGALSQTGAKSYIIVLNKDRTHREPIFVSADDCMDNKDGQCLLNADAVMDKLPDSQPVSYKVHMFIDTKDLLKNHYSLLPEDHLQSYAPLQREQMWVNLYDICEELQGDSEYEEKEGRVLQTKNMKKDLVKLRASKKGLEVMCFDGMGLKRIEQPCAIFNANFSSAFIKEDNAPLFISNSFHCLAPIADKCTTDYLVYAVINADKHFQNRNTKMDCDDYHDFCLPYFPSLQNQNALVRRLYNQQPGQISKKLERVEVLEGGSSDLLHNLGTSFSSLSAALNNLEQDAKAESVVPMKAKLAFALRQLDSTGADYEKVTPNLVETDIDQLLKTYTEAWASFGFHSFFIHHEPLTAGQIKCKVDVNLLYVALDCIFINAHQHGFDKSFKFTNFVDARVSYVVNEGKEYAMLSISNNGAPMPGGFSLADYVGRGVTGTSSTQGGLGGDHICKIAHLHGGRVSLDCTSYWSTVNVLLPVWLASDNLTPEDYDCESV